MNSTPLVRVERGHALLREVEVVGAVVEALFRLGIGPERAALLGGCVAQVVVEIGRAEADDRDVLRAPPLVDAVDVDVGERLRERVERVTRVVLRAEQALLLGGHREEEDRSLRRGFRPA